MKTDARVRYTRRVIQEAFFTLLAEQPVSKITVKEICELAQINRATFYKHYSDPFDLLETVKQQMLQNLQAAIARYKDEARGDFLVELLKNLKDHDQDYDLVCSENGDPSFSSLLTQTIYRELSPDVEQKFSGLPPRQQQMAFCFLAQGTGAALDCWMKSGMQESPEEMAGLINRLGKIMMKGLTAEPCLE